MTGSLSFDFFSKWLAKYTESNIPASNPVGMCTWHLGLFLDVKLVCLIGSPVRNQQANNHRTLIKKRTEVQLVCFHLQQSWKHTPYNFYRHCFQEGRRKTMYAPAAQHSSNPSFCGLGLWLLSKSQTKAKFLTNASIDTSYVWTGM